MMDELRPDIVSVCTPNVSHRTYTEAALQAGAHVFCEKPVAASYADAVVMYAVAEAADRHLFVTQTSRFSGANTAAKQLADSGHLGEMYYAETSAFRRRGVPTWGRFHMKEARRRPPLRHWCPRARCPAVDHGQPQSGGRLGRDVHQAGRPARRRWLHRWPTAARQRACSRPETTTLASTMSRIWPLAFCAWKTVPPLAFGPVGRPICPMAPAAPSSWAQGGLTFNPLTFIGTLGRYQADTRLNVPPDPSVPFSGHWKAAAHFVEVLEGRAELIVKKEEVLNVMAALDGLYRSATEGEEMRIG